MGSFYILENLTSLIRKNGALSPFQHIFIFCCLSVHKIVANINAKIKVIVDYELGAIARILNTSSDELLDRLYKNIDSI